MFVGGMRKSFEGGFDIARFPGACLMLLQGINKGIPGIFLILFFRSVVPQTFDENLLQVLQPSDLIPMQAIGNHEYCR